MPNCFANVSLDFLVLVSGSGGKAVWKLAVPYQPSLLGTHFFNQAIVLDPAAGNAFGAVMSDAAEGVVGG